MACNHSVCGAGHGRVSDCVLRLSKAISLNLPAHHRTIMGTKDRLKGLGVDSGVVERRVAGYTT